MAQQFHDSELGDVEVRRYVQSRGVKIHVAPKGHLLVSAPRGVPLFAIKQLVRANRKKLSQLHENIRDKPSYTYDQPIGKSHSLRFVQANVAHASVQTKQRVIIATIPDESALETPETQKAVQTEVIKALKKESRAYLTRRLAHLAKRHGFSYDNVRFTHAGTRWGSCSSNGTISLNIALMKLDYELIDYVIIHELCHTREMNHSSAFWAHVGTADPHYKQHKKILKNHSPAL